MFLSKFAINKPVTTIMIFFIIVVVGFYALNHIPISLLPNINYPKLTVSASWQGISPEEIEAKLTSPIESVGATISGVTDVSSTSYNGYSSVQFTFDRKTDISFAKFELNEKLQILSNKLPANVVPVISEYMPREFRDNDFLSYGISGPYELKELKEYLDKFFKYKILALPEVSNVSINGYVEKIFKIKIDKNKAEQILPYQIRQALEQNGKTASITNFKQNGLNYIIQSNNSYNNIDEIKDLKIRLISGEIIPLNQIATINEEKITARNYFRYNGNPQLILSIDKKSTANALKLAKSIKSIIKDQSGFLPKNIEIVKLSDESKKISSDLNVLYKRGIISLIAIFLVLLLFLRHVQSTILVLMTIFFSTLLTISLLYFLKIGLNMLSIAGLTLGFGMIVDNSIVVYENIFRFQSKGYDRKTASIKASGEVSLPIFASTLTTVIVFAPFLYMQGDLKLFYLPFVYATVISLLASLFISFTFIPLITYKYLKIGNSQVHHNSKGKFFYNKLISFLIRFKWIWLVIVLGFVSYTIWIFADKVDKGTTWNFPDDNFLAITISLPVGSNIEQTDYIAKNFEEKILDSGYKVQMKTRVYSEYAYIRVDFNTETQKTAVPLIIREKLKSYAVNFGNTDIYVQGFGPSFGGGGYSTVSHSFTITGYNYDKLKTVAENLSAFMKRVSRRVSDIDVNALDWWKNEKLYQYQITFLRDELAKYDINVYSIMAELYSKINSSQNSFNLKINEKEKDFVVIQNTGENYYDIGKLKNFIVQKENSVKLSDVAKIEKKEVLSEIRRKNKQYTRRINYEFRGSYKKNEKFMKSLKKLFKMPLGFRFADDKKLNFEDDKNNKQLLYLIFFAVLLVYMTLCALYESFKYPLIILFAIPLAFSGVSLIFYFTDNTFDSYAKIGLVLLSGIVVNNSIILIDHINKLKQKSNNLKKAIIRATTDRIRPILMTASTTIIGLIPMLLHSDVSKNDFWKLLSLSTIGGLITSTFFVLTFIPIVYYLMTKKQKVTNNKEYKI